MNTKNLTIKEFGEIIEQDYLTATALVKLMVKVGAAKEVGKRTVDGQRGKPSVVFEIAQDFDLSFWPDEDTVNEVNPLDIPTVKENPVAEVVS